MIAPRYFEIKSSPCTFRCCRFSGTAVWVAVFVSFFIKSSLNPVKYSFYYTMFSNRCQTKKPIKISEKSKKIDTSRQICYTIEYQMTILHKISERNY